MLRRADGDGTPIDDLLTAVQGFSNSLADRPEDVGVVTHGLVAWEEVQFDEEGRPMRAVLYAAVGDQATPTSSLGLALHLLETLKVHTVDS